MPTRERKRFIAGAVCPRCGVIDRIVTFTEGERQARECIDCGFRDLMPEPGGGDVPAGRLDAPVRRSETRAEPIRFYPRPPPREDSDDR